MRYNTIFIYHVQFDRYKNRADAKEAFDENLKAYFSENRLDFLMSALGGSVITRGIVFRNAGQVSLEDRGRLAEWIKIQPIFAVVHLGDPEEDSETIDYFRDVTEYAFSVPPKETLDSEDVTQAGTNP